MPIHSLKDRLKHEVTVNLVLQKEDYLQTLVNVSQKLQKQYPSANFDKKSVGNLIALIKQFMEDALGVKVPTYFFLHR